jgi:hypothetical protein
MPGLGYSPLGSEVNMRDTDSLAVVDDYLDYFITGVKPVLSEGCVSGLVPEAVDGFVSVERELVHRAREDDGGTTEVYRGVLTVAGVRYNFECRLFIDSDGSHFVADVPKFEPVEWTTAGVRVA